MRSRSYLAEQTPAVVYQRLDNIRYVEMGCSLHMAINDVVRKRLYRV